MTEPLAGCHSDFTGHEPRGRTTEAWFQSGWAMQQRGDHMTREPVMRRVVTPWIEKACGVKPQKDYDDPGCRGCSRYPKESA